MYMPPVPAKWGLEQEKGRDLDSTSYKEQRKTNNRFCSNLEVMAEQSIVYFKTQNSNKRLTCLDFRTFYRADTVQRQFSSNFPDVLG